MMNFSLPKQSRKSKYIYKLDLDPPYKTDLDCCGYFGGEISPSHYQVNEAAQLQTSTRLPSYTGVAVANPNSANSVLQDSKKVL